MISRRLFSYLINPSRISIRSSVILMIRDYQMKSLSRRASIISTRYKSSNHQRISLMAIYSKFYEILIVYFIDFLCVNTKYPIKKFVSNLSASFYEIEIGHDKQKKNISVHSRSAVCYYFLATIFQFQNGNRLIKMLIFPCKIERQIKYPSTNEILYLNVLLLYTITYSRFCF